MSQECTLSQEIPQLLQSHVEHLKASAISVEVVKRRGYRSIIEKAELLKLGFSKAQSRPPGILVPVWSVDGSGIVGYQFRPDTPRVNSKGKRIKYETPTGASNRVDCPPDCQDMLSDPSIPLWVTEGAKKADSLVTQGECVIDLPGVWNWKGKNTLGGITILSDFDYIALNGRQVYLAFDSDSRTNPNVEKALARLAEHLQRKGAKVNLIHLPSEGMPKVGVDDYLAAGHTIDDIIALATVPAEEIEKKKEKEVCSCYAYYKGNLYLEIRQFDHTYAFACLNKDNEVGLVSEIATGDITLRPRPLPVSEGRTIAFVSMPDENIVTADPPSPGKLYRQIEGHFRKYIDLPDLDLQLCIYYVLFTWFYQKVNTLGYLRFLADTGKGKSRILQVVGDVCFYPVWASGASSFSGTARQQDKWRGTLVIDESDFQGDKESQFTKYLNLGFERGKPYVLSDKQNPKRQEFFEPFSPKILAMREPFGDPATEGRILSVSPHETSDPAIPIILLSDYWYEAQALRNKLARFALEHWHQINGEKMLNFHDLGIEPRLQQLAMPLSIIFQLWPEGVEQFRQYLVARQREIRRDRSQSWQGSLFNLVYSIAVGDFDLQEEFASYYEPQSRQIQAVTPSMVARQMKSSAKAVTQGLVSIGFQVERRGVTIYSRDDTQNEGKVRVVRCYTVPSQKAWAEIVNRYFYEEDETARDIELPDILRSTKFVYEKELVYVEPSKVSNASTEPSPTPSFDTFDRFDASAHTKNTNDGKPARPCFTCGSTNWWQRTDGEWICAVCHPNPSQSELPEGF